MTADTNPMKAEYADLIHRAAHRIDNLVTHHYSEPEHRHLCELMDILLAQGLASLDDDAGRLKLVRDLMNLDPELKSAFHEYTHFAFEIGRQYETDHGFPESMDDVSTDDF